MYLNTPKHAHMHICRTILVCYELCSSCRTGNGKTLRTERAMRAFVKNWITMSGPSSAKAGMQGTHNTLYLLNPLPHPLPHLLTVRR